MDEMPPILGYAQVSRMPAGAARWLLGWQITNAIGGSLVMLLAILLLVAVMLLDPPARYFCIPLFPGVNAGLLYFWAFECGRCRQGILLGRSAEARRALILTWIVVAVDAVYGGVIIGFGVWRWTRGSLDDLMSCGVALLPVMGLATMLGATIFSLRRVQAFLTQQAAIGVE